MAQSTEVPAARSESTSTFVNPDGTRSLRASTEAINYRDARGTWQPIDTSVVPDPGVPGGLVSKANAWTVHSRRSE